MFACLRWISVERSQFLLVSFLVCFSFVCTRFVNFWILLFLVIFCSFFWWGGVSFGFEEMENLGTSSTSKEESFFDFMHAEHAPSSSNKGGGTTTHGYKSAVAGPVFDFGNDDLLPSFEFQPEAEARKSTTTQQVDDRARRNLSPFPLVSYPVAFFFSSLETQGYKHITNMS